MEDILNEIKFHYQVYSDLVGAQTRLNNQLFAICYRLCDGDETKGGKLINRLMKKPTDDDCLRYGWVIQMAEAMPIFQEKRNEHEKVLKKLARELPAYDFAKSVKGLGDKTFAKIIGCTGNLSNYSRKEKVWKRLGVAVMPDGRQRKHKDAALAILHGYSPKRRSEVFVMGDCVMQAQLRRNKETEQTFAIGSYGQMYLDRKQYEIERNPDIHPKHAHMSAKRIMEKAVIKNLWQAWRREA